MQIKVVVLVLTPVFTLVHVETCPFKTALCLLGSLNIYIKSSADPPFYLKIIFSCHTLSNAFDISRKTILTSNPSSNDLYNSCVIDKSWLIQESAGLKPD